MKCVQCGTDNNLQDRTENNGRCKECNHPFAFEPQNTQNREQELQSFSLNLQNRKQELRFTDPFFANAIRQLSNDDSLYFTPKQFRYFLDKKIKKRYLHPALFSLFSYLFYAVWSTGFFGIFFNVIIQILGININDINIFLIVLFGYQILVIALLSKNTQFILLLILYSVNRLLWIFSKYYYPGFRKQYQ